MTAALCTICIPAYRAAPFIARTLGCAQRQTEQSIAIHVSVDQGDDDTADICEAIKTRDPRIKVWRQAENIGWVANTNFLIGQVETPYYFLYFHDDLIGEDYVRRLCGLLEARSDAATAHADMGHFGATEHVAEGAEFSGEVFERLFQFLDNRNQPPLLRAMTRAAPTSAGGLRIPDVRGSGIGAHHVYVLGLLAAGPSLHVPEVLYARHNRRPGGLTEGWRHLSFAEVRDAFADNAEALLRLDGAKDQDLLRLVAYLFSMVRLRTAELERDMLDPMSASSVSPHLADIAPLEILAGASVSVRERGLRAYATLLYLEGNQSERRRDFDGALTKYTASAVANDGRGPAMARIENVRRKASKAVSEKMIATGFESLAADDRLRILREIAP